MKKKDMVLIFVILAVASLLMLVRPEPTGDVGNAYVRVDVDGQEHTRVMLSAPRTVSITQADGMENRIEVTTEGVSMLFSSCDNQLCVHQGKVTTENYEMRPMQGFIICLPNRVTVEFVPNAE